MKVKMKLGELQSVIVSLQAVKAKKLPVKVQYALAVNIKTLTEKYVAYNAQRTEILEKDCVKDADGHPVLKDRVTKNAVGKVVDTQQEYTYGSDDDRERTLKEVAELNSIEEELEMNKITLEELERCDEEPYDGLTGTNVQDMLFMISE